MPVHLLSRLSGYLGAAFSRYLVPVLGIIAAGIFLNSCRSMNTATIARHSPGEGAALDYGFAQQYCDRTELAGPEGIWQFPDDETTVLIRRSPHFSSKYDIFVIETPDCRLNPGDKLGELQRSADTSKFKLHLFTSRKMGILANPHTCAAELKEDGDAFIMHPLKVNLSLRTFWFLPRFWRSLRLSIDNPSSRIPYGMIRLYPRTTPLSPFYL